MRKKGLITVAIIIAITVIISIIFTDKLIERGIEKTIQSLTGARAEIDNLDLDVLSLGIEWNRLQIADPKKPYQNFIETGRVAFSLNLAALLKRKYVINEINLLNVRSGTRRETDGSLPKQIKEIKKRSPSKWDKVKNKITHQLGEAKIFDFSVKDISKSLNADSLIAKVNLQIIDNYGSISTDIETTSDKWKEYYSQFYPQEKLDNIKEQIRDIELEKINRVDKAIKEIEKVRTIQKTIEEYSKEVSKKQDEAEADFNRLSGYKEQYRKWLSQDYKNILEKAQFPDFTFKNLSKIIFGKTVILKLDRYMGYAETLSRIAGKERGKKKQRSPRLQGQNIRFSEKQSWPTFLIKKIEISTGKEQLQNQKVLYLEGKVTGLTTQPQVYGKPTIIDLKGIYNGNREILFNSVLDRTQENYFDNYSLGFRNISLDNVGLEKNRYLPENIKSGFADIDIDISNDEQKMEVVLFLQGKALEYEFSDTSDHDEVSTTVREIFKGLDRLYLKSKIVIEDQTYTFDISSNLDKRFSQSVSSTTTRKLMEVEKNIKSKLQEKADKRIKDLDKKYENIYSKYLQPILEHKKEIDLMKIELADKLKELQKKHTRDLGKKAEDLLDDLLKKKK